MKTRILSKSKTRKRFERRFLWNTAPQSDLETPNEARCPYQRGAMSLLEERPELDVVVCGHTHVPARCQSADGVYLNSGAIAGGHFVWVELDTTARIWTLRQGLTREEEENLGVT